MDRMEELSPCITWCMNCSVLESGRCVSWRGGACPSGRSCAGDVDALFYIVCSETNYGLDCPSYPAFLTVPFVRVH